MYVAKQVCFEERHCKSQSTE